MYLWYPDGGYAFICISAQMHIRHPLATASLSWLAFGPLSALSSVPADIWRRGSLTGGGGWHKPEVRGRGSPNSVLRNGPEVEGGFVHRYLIDYLGNFGKPFYENRLFLINLEMFNPTMSRIERSVLEPSLNLPWKLGIRNPLSLVVQHGRAFYVGAPPIRALVPLRDHRYL